MANNTKKKNTTEEKRPADNYSKQNNNTEEKQPADNNSKKNNIISVTVFLILALTLAVFCITIFRMKEPDENTENISETTADTETGNENNESEEIDEDISNEAQDNESADKKEEIPDNNSNKEISEKSEWSEISETETDYIIDRKNNNNFTVKLDQLLERDDIADSFSIVLHSEDGVSPLGEIKYGLGFSLTRNFDDERMQKWHYVPDDVFSTEESSCTIEYIIPDEKKPYIDTSGELFFGYWWGDNESVVVEKIVCHRTKRGMEKKDNAPEETESQETE